MAEYAFTVTPSGGEGEAVRASDVQAAIATSPGAVDSVTVAAQSNPWVVFVRTSRDWTQAEIDSASAAIAAVPPKTRSAAP